MNFSSGLRFTTLCIAMNGFATVGCLQGAPVTAVGPCAQAVGAPVTLNLSPSITANLGTDAVEAAGNAARSYFAGIPGALTYEENQKASALALKAAETRLGRPLSADSKNAIEQGVQIMADHEVSCRR